MTSFDDDQLSELLKRAAAEIAPPADGADKVLAAAVDPQEPGLAPATRSARRLLVPTRVAASVVVLAAVAVSIASFTRSTPPARRAAAPNLSVSSTTIPQGTEAGDHVTTGTGSPLGDWTDAGAPDTLNGTAYRVQASSGSLSEVRPGSTATKVVATGTVELAVASTRVRHVLSSLSSLVTRDLGYVASSDAHTAAKGATGTATIVLRVPVSRFSALVAQVQRQGAATSVVTHTDDVTGEYVDYEARIAALDDSRRQYLAIMAKATTIADILAIQAQVNVIESEIEQLGGQRNLLVDEAAYATLSVGINVGPARALAAESGLRRSVHDSIAGFVAGFEWLVRAVGPALFALLLLLCLLFASRTSWRRVRRRML